MKKLIAATTTGSLLLLSTMQAYAQDAQGATKAVNICPADGVFFKLCTLSSTKFSDLVGVVISILLLAAVVIAIIFLVWGGIKWILSGGDKAGVESARNHIVAALVGLAIALAAYFLLNIVLGFFGINVTSFDLPKFVK